MYNEKVVEENPIHCILQREKKQLYGNVKHIVYVLNWELTRIYSEIRIPNPRHTTTRDYGDRAYRTNHRKPNDRFQLKAIQHLNILLLEVEDISSLFLQYLLSNYGREI